MARPSDVPDTLIRRGVEHREAGKLGQAEKALRQATAEVPRSKRALHELGVTLYVAEQFGDARSALTRALLLGDESWENLLYLALTCQHMADAAAAARFFDRAIAVAGEDEDLVRSFHGEYLAAHGDFEKAEQEFRAALELSSDCATTHRLFGKMLDFRDRIGEAEGHLRRAVELEPDRPLNLFCLGKLLYRQPAKAAEGKLLLRRAAEAGSERAQELISENPDDF